MDNQVKNPILKNEGSINTALAMVAECIYPAQPVSEIKTYQLKDGAMLFGIKFVDESVGPFDVAFYDDRVSTQQRANFIPLVNVEKLKQLHAKYIAELKQFVQERNAREAGSAAQSVLSRVAQPEEPKAETSEPQKPEEKHATQATKKR